LAPTDTLFVHRLPWPEFHLDDAGIELAAGWPPAGAGAGARAGNDVVLAFVTNEADASWLQMCLRKSDAAMNVWVAVPRPHATWRQRLQLDGAAVVLDDDWTAFRSRAHRSGNG
jgi:hypothetical protein